MRARGDSLPGKPTDARVVAGAEASGVPTPQVSSSPGPAAGVEALPFMFLGRGPVG